MTSRRPATPLRTAVLAVAVLLASSCTGPAPLVDVYVDPVAGDLGAWQRDAAGRISSRS